jgi:hypothetical protein
VDDGVFFCQGNTVAPAPVVGSWSGLEASAEDEIFVPVGEDDAASVEAGEEAPPEGLTLPFAATMLCQEPLFPLYE